MLLGKNVGQLQTDPERIKCLAKAEMMPVGDVFGGQSKVWCCKEQYFIGTWNVMSMNQGKLKVVKQEMARLVN